MKLSTSLLALLLLTPLPAQDDFIPRRQDRPPGPPKSPAEALAAMRVPDGFTVELVASEPELRNPTAMTIDEKGRFWVCESFEYPRREPGVGRDRVKVLEDTDGDGAVDSVKVFADGLNIPCAVAVGHGGVWVSNSPDVLFYPDADRDAVPDGPPEVVVTGFGRDDTHELPNSFTWGPDGWLYGLNGVFNHSSVTYPESNPNHTADQTPFDFTCAVYRIHPVTREFQVFAEGVSNQWGIAFNDDGEMFLSACVIDHLWHITESGYYIRQGGPYPPHTWPMGSIVDYTHQKAAYCGIHWGDTDGWPEEWRRVLFMGNIHGNCVNTDALESNGSTYKGVKRPDFLTADDVWFMPVAQKTGPDGSLYVLDWYDRYHCYQDANRDPDGVDRGHGRLYRVRYDDAPRWSGDSAAMSDDELTAALDGPNEWVRDTARRLLTERLSGQTGNGGGGETPESSAPRSPLRERLEFLALDPDEQPTVRRGAMFTLIGAGPLGEAFHAEMLGDADATLRAFAVRAAGNEAAAGTLPWSVRVALGRATNMGATGRVAAQYAVALPKLNPPGTARPPRKPRADDGLVQNLMGVLGRAGDDPLLPKLVWENLQPRIEDDEFAVLGGLQRVISSTRGGDDTPPWLAELLPRVVDRLLDARGSDPKFAAQLLMSAVRSFGPDAPALVLDRLADRVGDAGFDARGGVLWRRALARDLDPLLSDPQNPAHFPAARLDAALGGARGAAALRAVLDDSAAGPARRVAAAEALIAGGDDTVLDAVAAALANADTPAELRGGLVEAVGRVDSPRVADVLLAAWPGLPADLRPKVSEQLTRRPAWAKALLEAVSAGTVPKDSLNLTQIRRLLASPAEEIVNQTRSVYGTVREGRDPDRERVIDEVDRLLANRDGDVTRGKAVFTRVCGQCHKLYGEGAEVGPDLTNNGRNDFRQLLSNVYDPNLVIGAAYRAHTVVTEDGRVLSGLLVEDGADRIVLTVQGGRREVIARSDVLDESVAPVSLMPEGLEKQMTDQQTADLFAYLRTPAAP